MDRMEVELKVQDEKGEIIHDKQNNVKFYSTKKSNQKLSILNIIILFLLIAAFIYMNLLYNKKFKKISDYMIEKEEIDNLILKIYQKSLDEKVKNFEEESQELKQANLEGERIKEKLEEIKPSIEQKYSVNNQIEDELSKIKSEINQIKNKMERFNQIVEVEKKALENEKQKMKIVNTQNEDKLNEEKKDIEDEKKEEEKEENKKVKETANETKKIDSKIIEQNNELNLVENSLKKVNNGKNVKYTLLYRATRDGDSALMFHKKCDNIKGTLALIKTDKDLKIGGYTKEKWNPADNIWIKDKEAFVFSLTNNEIFYPIRGETAIYPNISMGPSFGRTLIGIWDQAFKYGGYTNIDLDFNYKKCQLINGEKHFYIKEIEVYQITFE